MAENNLQSQVEAILPKTGAPPTPPPENPEHPLQALHNQADQETKERNMLQKPIRTYESDVAEALAKQKSSVVTMMTAENERKIASKISEEKINKSPASSGRSSGKKVFMLLISLVFIAGGLGGAYYFYLQSPLVGEPIVQPEVRMPSVINPDIQTIIATDSLQKNQLTQILSNEFDKYEAGDQIGDNKILELVLMQSVNGTTSNRVSATQLINSLGWGMDDTLKRSVTSNWMLGIYSSPETNEDFPFIVLKNDFFQNAFAGMFKWESSMPDDLVDLLGYKNKALGEEAMSTTSVATYFNIRGTFEDRIIRNRDIREFISERGELLFLYTFLSKDLILITTSEAVIPALLDRIDKQTYVR